MRKEIVCGSHQLEMLYYAVKTLLCNKKCFIMLQEMLHYAIKLYYTIACSHKHKFQLLLLVFFALCIVVLTT